MIRWLLVGGPHDGQTYDVSPDLDAIRLHDDPDAAGAYRVHVYRAHRFVWRGQQYRIGTHDGLPLSVAQQQALGAMVRRLGLRPMG